MLVLGVCTSIGIAWVAAILESPEPGANVVLGKPQDAVGHVAGHANEWWAAEWRHRGLTSRLIVHRGSWYRFDTEDELPLPDRMVRTLPPRLARAGR